MISWVRRVFGKRRSEVDREMEEVRREHHAALDRANRALTERHRLDALRSDYERADAVMARRR